MRVSRHSSAARPYCPQVCSWVTACPVTADRLVCISGGVVVVAGLQQLFHVLFAALRDGVDPPLPERRRPLVGLPGGGGVQRGDGPGCPPVHEMQRLLVPAGHRREQPGGPGRGHRGGQASRRVDGRPPLLGQVSLVAGVLLCGQPGVFQETWPPTRLAASLMACRTRRDAGLTPGVGRPLGGLADLEDQGGVIDRDPVDRRPDHQLDGQRGGRQPAPAARTAPRHRPPASRPRPGWRPGPGRVPGQPGRRVGDAAVPQPVLHPLATSSKRACPPRSSASRYSRVRGWPPTLR